jgi:hypothetical protein
VRGGFDPLFACLEQKLDVVEQILDGVAFPRA